MMSALYSSATGMKSLSTGMQNIGNNLANTNTVGFKQTMMLYEDLISSSVMTKSNFVTEVSQKGMGVSVSATKTLFNQSGFESSNTVTDLAISGKGFFGVANGDQTYYTRAGNFRFDKDGQLLDPSGYQLLGRQIVDGVVGTSPVPIQVDMSEGSAAAINKHRPTSTLAMYSNLGITSDNSGSNSASPLFDLASQWNGTQNPPLSGQKFSYSDPVQIVDNNGDYQNLEVFYDLAEERNGFRVMEFTVGMSPELDGSANAGTAAAGLLMTGTLTFNSAGQLVNMSAYTPTGSNPADLSAWQGATLTEDGVSFTANFAGSGAQTISLDFGLNIPEGQLNSAGATPAAAAANSGSIFGVMSGATRTNAATTGFGGSSASIYQRQDGYPEGSLQNLVVSPDGTVSGRYSNGNSQDLFQISLYRFTSEDGLRREGNNHYSATMESGAADEGLPKQENFGEIAGNSLELSNVDTSREFTHMIINQRAFQANSKIMTTSDTMLQKALELKR